MIERNNKWRIYFQTPAGDDRWGSDLRKTEIIAVTSAEACAQVLAQHPDATIVTYVYYGLDTSPCRGAV